MNQEEKDFTEEQKEKLLLMHGFEKFVGYPLGYEAPESDNIIVTLEEIRKWVGEPAQTFFMAEHDECVRDLEDAWECLTESIYELIDSNDEKEVDAYLLNKILSAEEENSEPHICCWNGERGECTTCGKVRG